MTEFRQPLFSIEEAQALVRQRDDLFRQYEAVNRRLIGLAAFLPDHTREQVFGTSAIAGPSSAPLDLVPTPLLPSPSAVPLVSQPSMQDVIVNMLDEVLEVRSQDEIEEYVWSKPFFSNREVNSPAVIARALERASRNSRIKKRGLNYFSNKIPVKPDGSFLVGVGVNTSTVVGAIEKLLRETDESLEPWEIIDKLKNDPDVGEKVGARPQGVYAALSRLASRRIAYRDVDGYRIKSK